MKPAAFLIQGDARRLPLPDASVHCVVTSPPYWGLRDYGLVPLVWDDSGGCAHSFDERRYYTEQSAAASDGSAEAFSEAGPENANRLKKARWRVDGLCRCGAWRGSLGLEPTPDLYVQHLVEVFREVRRVLRDDGTVWLNLGDSYTSGGRDTRDPGQSKIHPAFENWQKGNRPGTPLGLKPKDLIGIPWRVAFALQADGWWLRSDIIWSKPNPMPESVTDRPTKSHEYLFLLTKGERYYYDAEAIKEPSQSGPSDVRKMVEGYERFGGKHKALDDPLNKASAATNIGRRAGVGSPDGRNRRTVWEIPTAPFPGAHFATFPPELVKPCVLAGCPVGGMVLDPFAGSGTVVLVAQELGRVGVGVELKAEYLAMGQKRTAQGVLP